MQIDFKKPASHGAGGGGQKCQHLEGRRPSPPLPLPTRSPLLVGWHIVGCGHQIVSGEVMLRCFNQSCNTIVQVVSNLEDEGDGSVIVEFHPVMTIVGNKTHKRCGGRKFLEGCVSFDSGARGFL